MATEYREEHRREALLGTVMINAALAALFFFTVFKGPDPPLEELAGGDGVELNYGVDEVGSGDIQSQAPANESKNREDSRPPASQPDPTPPRPVSQPDLTPPTEQRVVTSEAEESPVTVPPAKKVAEAPKEEVKPEPPRPKVDQRAVFTPRANRADGGGNGVNGTSNAPTGNNNGDNPGTVGDKGDPRGTYGGTAYSGEPGKGGRGTSPGSGGSLSMPGWAFENQPRDVDPSDERGSVTLKIKIDEDGSVESVSIFKSTVSRNVAEFYRAMVQRKATFRRVADGSGGATGTVTYIIGGR
ncbi:energy transducer TonB [Hymenobacter sp. DG01]|uniref:energy transducer TonB n=1 Tax=Hymenobacter sp. DG01 TaxID=2584940 RepID=UPI0011222BB4|nr:energy transducer TonB [Hymenobacter sp. DG01]